MELYYHPDRTKQLVFGLLVASYLSVRALSFVGPTPAEYVRIAVAPFAVLFYFTLIPFDAIDNQWLHLGSTAYAVGLIAYYYAVAYAIARLVGSVTAALPIHVERPE